MTDEEAIAFVVAACRSAKERSLEQPPEVEWIVPLVLPRGVLVDLHGDPKAGKSTLLAHLVRAVLDGRDIFRQRTTKTKVVWFTEQPRATFARLLESAGLYDHPELIVLYHQEVLGVSWRHRMAAVTQVARAEKAGLVLIDTFSNLAGIRGDNENKSGAILDALTEFQQAKAEGIAIVIVRHDRKSRGSVLDGGRGSNAFTGEADIIYQLVREAKDAPNMRRLGYEGRLDEIPVSRRIVLEDGEYRDLGTSAERAARAAYEAMWADWERIVSVAPDMPENAIPGTKLAKVVKEKCGLGRDTTLNRLAEYREHVEEWGPSRGMLVWDGEDGRGGYWRICECRMESVTCGSCERCTNGEPCQTWRLVTDPACTGHDYARAQGQPEFPGPQTPEI